MLNLTGAYPSVCNTISNTVAFCFCFLKHHK